MLRAEVTEFYQEVNKVRSSFSEEISSYVSDLKKTETIVD